MTTFSTSLKLELIGGGGRGSATGRQTGSVGAVRIVWPGDKRKFPSTDVGAT